MTTQVTPPTPLEGDALRFSLMLLDTLYAQRVLDASQGKALPAEMDLARVLPHAWLDGLRPLWDRAALPKTAIWNDGYEVLAWDEPHPGLIHPCATGVELRETSGTLHDAHLLQELTPFHSVAEAAVWEGEEPGFRPLVTSAPSLPWETPFEPTPLPLAAEGRAEQPRTSPLSPDEARQALGEGGLQTAWILHALIHKAFRETGETGKYDAGPKRFVMSSETKQQLAKLDATLEPILEGYVANVGTRNAYAGFLAEHGLFSMRLAEAGPSRGTRTP